MSPTRLLLYEDFRARGIPYHRAHIRRLENVGKFPKHVELGDGGRVAWVEAEVDEWVRSRMAKRDAVSQEVPLVAAE